MANKIGQVARSSLMTLDELLALLPGARLLPNSAGTAGAAQAAQAAQAVTGVADDSREVGPGDVFVAIARSADGHGFVEVAAAAGACAAVVEREVETRLPQVLVADSAEAFGQLAAHFAGNPAERMSLVGITGTNGKTTTAYLVEAVLEAARQSPGVIGTVSYRYGGQDHPAPYTTPTPRILHRTFRQMADAGCSHVVMEVSSAALAMDRMAAVRFRVGAFTNLTQDHLDVHETMEGYCAAKARLLADYLADDGIAVINIDDPTAPHMIAAAGDRRVLRVSIHADTDAEVRVVASTSTIDGITATLETPSGELHIASKQLIGGYNISNIAVAVAIAVALDIPLEAIARGISDMAGVPGRVERVANSQGLDILVDYAHTPDALHNVLSALAPLTGRRLICVFGCGGDRDPGKRPLMGAAVAELADLAVVTSDNPRTEDPQRILEMIVPAVPTAFFVDVDRRTAIRAAVAEATPGDIVVIAGKGHEDYQILGTSKVHFDDREEAAAAAAARQSLSSSEIQKATAATVVGASEQAFTRVIIDGREAAQGDLYVAIRGERFDGHDFCRQAVDAGASALVVDIDATIDVPDHVTVFAVEDTRLALGQIARLVSRRWGLADADRRLIAITGSAGKTTTKELTRAALSFAGRVHAAAGSLNNETGVPLTLLGLRDYHDYAVVEMGMRGLGQIAYLVELAEPHVGIVVNAGTAHVGVVGSVDQIAEGKAEIFEALPSYGCAIYPDDDPRLAEHASGAPRTLTFGESENADVRLVHYQPAGAAGADVGYQVKGRRIDLRLALPGRHNALNAACALAAAMAVGVEPELAARGLARARPAPMRGEVRQLRGRNVLVDCYNANPSAVQAALDTLLELAAGARAVAVLGDMLELGDEATTAHRQVGARAEALGISVIALGDHAVDLAALAGDTARVAADPTAAADDLEELTEDGDWILLKASRGMRLERVLEAFERKGETS